MLLTLAEATAELPSLTQAQVIDLTSGLSHSLQTACNRVFADRVEPVSVNGTKAVLTVYHHGFEVGDRVRITTSTRDTDLDLSDVTINAENFSRDTFEVDSTQATAPPGTTVITVRRIRESIEETTYDPRLQVAFRPLVDVVKLYVTDDAGGWTEILSDKFVIADVQEGKGSKSGEIVLLEQKFPSGPMRMKIHPAGAKVEYVAGEPVPPPQIIYALKGLLGKAMARTSAADFASESFDFYSYSRRMDSENIGSLFGEADRIIKEMRLPL